jgi:hypothetical protein
MTTATSIADAGSVSGHAQWHALPSPSRQAPADGTAVGAAQQGRRVVVIAGMFGKPCGYTTQPRAPRTVAAVTVSGARDFPWRSSAAPGMARTPQWTELTQITARLLAMHYCD